MKRAIMDRMDNSGRMTAPKLELVPDEVGTFAAEQSLVFSQLPYSPQTKSAETYKKPQTHQEYLQGQLAKRGIQTDSMSYVALRAFTTAQILSDGLIPGEPPEAVRTLAASPDDYSSLVLVGLAHFSHPHEFATGTE